MNTGIANNVVGLHKKSVSDVIGRFLKEYNSENTKVTYTRHFSKMFMYMLNKDIEDLTEEDLRLITLSLVREYREFLTDNYNINTVNQMIFTCKKLWSYLIGEELVEKNVFEMGALKNNKKEVTYGSFTEDELEQLYEYCLSLPDRGMTKKLYFEFLATVTCRKTVAQNMKPVDIIKTFNRKDKNYYWVINGFDKTKTVDKAITEEFYRRLIDNFNSYSEKDKAKGLLFNVENQTLEKTLNDFCREYKIDKKGRNLCQHSIKSTGLDIIQDTLQDIRKTAKAGGHSDINTTYKRYLGKNEDYSSQPSIILHRDTKNCMEQLSALSKEELLTLIESCDKFVAIKLCLKKDGII